MSDQSNQKAIVLLSGGLDSVTAAAIAKSDGCELYALSVDYGQRHRFELEASKKIAEKLQVKRHVITKIDLSCFGGSALTDDIEVPKDREISEMESGIPITYVPARNTVFLSLALGWAEVVDAENIYIGVNAVDYSGYPDCRPEFIQSFQQLAQLATKAGVEGTRNFKIHTPLIDLTKAEIIEKGVSLGVDYSLTHTCYSPNEAGVSCGKCDACLLRLKGFSEAGLTDPIQYQS